MGADATRRSRRRRPAGAGAASDQLRSELSAFFDAPEAAASAASRGTGPRALVVHTICAGNICRSPLAEELLRTRLRQVGVPATVTSSGLTALVGNAADAPVQRIAAEQGLDLSGHRARMFEPAFAAEADLVLTATRAQRDEVLTLAPAATRRTFTLAAFAEIVSGLGPVPAGPEPLLALIDEASVARQLHSASERDDIPDPYRRKERAHREAFARIDVATRTIAEALAREALPGH